MGAEGADGGADGDLDDRSPDSPSLPLRALLPDGSVLDANPTRRADEVTVGSRSGGLGIATSGTTGVGSGTTRARWCSCCRCARGSRGWCFARAPTAWRRRDLAGRRASRSRRATTYRRCPAALRSRRGRLAGPTRCAPVRISIRIRTGGRCGAASPSRSSLAEPTPPARVLRLTAANVTGGVGSSSSGSSPFTGEDFTGTSSSSALEMRSARFVIRPSFPNPATNAVVEDESRG